jgi:hypothetical protein
MAEVKIGARFFSGAFHEYRDVSWAFIREILQNSLDAEATQIDVVIGEGKVRVRDNGVGMTRDVIENKLLTLGESGKEFAGSSVGGFGKAKEILYFAQDGYVILTHRLSVVGTGGSYEIRDDMPYQQGTLSEVTWSASHPCHNLREDCIRFISLVDRADVRFTVNGKQAKSGLSGTTLKSIPGLGDVFTTTKAIPDQLVVRHKGLPMFTRQLEAAGKGVIVELDLYSRLTANRDGLIYGASCALQSFVDEVTVNKISSLRKLPITTYVNFGSRKICVEGKLESPDFWVPVARPGPRGVVPTRFPGTAQEMVEAPRVVADSVADPPSGMAFVLKNSTGMKTPGCYLPTGFGHYQESLLAMWVNSLVAAYQMLDKEGEFKVGFILSSDRDAEHEYGGDGHSYLINPAEVVVQKSSSSRSFRNKYKLTDWHKVAALAVHEVCHGIGNGGHDEVFARQLTDMIALALANVKTFRKSGVVPTGFWRSALVVVEDVLGRM